MTISLPDEVAVYLRSKRNASSIVAEAVVAYRTREQKAELENAYREGAKESEALNREWQNADAALED